MLRIFDVYSWLSIKRLADTTEFRPSERWMPHTPELTTTPDPLEVPRLPLLTDNQSVVNSLDLEPHASGPALAAAVGVQVEIAMFMVPDRNDFDHVKLCPGDNVLESEIKPVFDTNG